jgi:hypothetical protein
MESACGVSSGPGFNSGVSSWNKMVVSPYIFNSKAILFSKMNGPL